MTTSDTDLVRLTAPNGAVVNVSTEKAERLLASGYKTAERDTKAPAKKAAASRKTAQSD